MGGDLGEFTCGKRWVYIGDHQMYLQVASLTAPSEAFTRLSGRISSGAAPPSRPLSQGVTFFETSRGSNTSSKLEHFGFILGSPGPQKTRFSCGRCCIFRKIEPKSLPEASRDLPELTLALLGLILPLLGVIWGLLGLVLDLLWASWDAPGVLPGRSREPLGSFLALQKLPEALPEAPRTGA